MKSKPQERADDGMQNNSKSKPKLDDLAASQIGKMLRAHFDDALNEQVPDRFKSLLDRLEAAEKSTDKGAKHE